MTDIATAEVEDDKPHDLDILREFKKREEKMT